MRKIWGIFIFSFLNLFCTSVLAASLSDVSGAGGVLMDEQFVSESISKNLGDLSLTGDFGADETVVVDFSLGGTGDLNFTGSGSTINFVTTDGNVTIDNIVGSADSVTFQASGTGTLKLMDIGAFASNATTTEFFEKRQVRVQLDGNTYMADEFVVDTTNYTNKGNFLGMTGGVDGDIFKVGDTLRYGFLPYDFSARGDFEIDLSSLGGSGTMDVDETFEIIDGSIDGTGFFSVTLTYSGTEIKKTFSSKTVSVDNIRPSFASTDVLTLPEGKSIVGIGDEITFTPPADQSGDNVRFAVDFSDIAGSVANFQNEAGEKKFVLLETNIESSTYSKPIQLRDDAGNAESPSIETNVISVDLRKPVVADTNLLSVENGVSPARYGSNIHLEKPTDVHGNDLTFSIDLSPLGGSETNYKTIDESQDFSVQLGNLQNENFSASLTVYDPAGNTATATTNVILVDNKPPSFNTTCGATFTVLDVGDDNGAADFSAGGPDQVIFTSPNSNLAGCEDLNTFSIDLSGISGTSSNNFVKKPADGTLYTLTVVEGNLDYYANSFPIRIFDAFENYADYSSGNLTVDNKLPKMDDFNQEYSILNGELVEKELFVQDRFNLKLSSEINDIVSLKAQIVGGTGVTELNQKGDYWEGILEIISGELKQELMHVTFTGVDDQGNFFTFLSNRTFLISNDTTVIHGGGGGTSNLGKGVSMSRERVKRNFFNESRAKKEAAWKKLLLQNLAKPKKQVSTPEPVPAKTLKIPEKPKELSYYEKFQLQLRQSRNSMMKRVARPNKMEKSIKKIARPNFREKDWEKCEDKKGGFRLGNSLEKMKKNSVRKSKKQLPTLRKTSVNKREKYGSIRR